MTVSADRDALREYYEKHCALKKPEPRMRSNGRKKREHWKRQRNTRDYIFGRERNRCRCCRFRQADTMHEIIFRSRGGKVNCANSIAVCGDGVRGCHGFMQRHEIGVEMEPEGAEGTLMFTATSAAAADWMRIPVGHTIESFPMRVVEAEE